jgi:hypothetical protein
VKNYPRTVMIGQYETFSVCLPNLPNRLLTYTIAYPDGTTQEAKVLSDRTGYSKERFLINFQPQGSRDSVSTGVSYQDTVQIATRFAIQNQNNTIETSTPVKSDIVTPPATFTPAPIATKRPTIARPQPAHTPTVVSVATTTGCVQSGPVRGDTTTCDVVGSQTRTAVPLAVPPTNVPVATALDTATEVPTGFPTAVPPTDTPIAADTATDIPTYIPTVPPTATAIVFDDGGDACVNARTAANTVVRFYMAIDQRQYASAYGCLSSAWQAGTSLDKWVAGYDTTVASPLVVADQLDPTTVSAVLDALDQKNGELIATTFAFRWQLDDNGLLTHATDTHHSSRPVDSAPTTYPMNVIA